MRLQTTPRRYLALMPLAASLSCLYSFVLVWDSLLLDLLHLPGLPPVPMKLWSSAIRTMYGRIVWALLSLSVTCSTCAIVCFHQKRYLGKGVLKAVANVNTVLSDALKGHDLYKLGEL